MKEIYLAGGCFWGLQKFFDQFEGVISTEVGYANGPEYTDQHAPSYEEVCRSSGHAETVKVTYDENLLSLPELLRYYFMVIDPVSVNRQGNDRGVQYRTGIYFTEMAQLLGGELRAEVLANYLRHERLPDCTFLPENALYQRTYGTLPEGGVIIQQSHKRSQAARSFAA